MLLTKLLQATVSPALNRERFRILKQRRIDQLANNHKDKPYDQALSRQAELLLSDLWTNDQELAATQALSYDDLKAFSQRFVRQLDPVMLVHGNLSRASALNMETLVEGLLKGSDAIKVARPAVHALPEQQDLHFRWPVDHNDTGYVRYLQGKDSSFTEQGRYLLLGQLISTPFYESIRTQAAVGLYRLRHALPVAGNTRAGPGD